MNEYRSPIKTALENLVIVAIILVLIQTFLEDYAVLAGWEWDLRRTLIFTGFGFDLFFTIEFCIRIYYAALNHRTKAYFFRERGWIDLLASVPLLMLNSGPTALAIMAGGGAVVGTGGVMNILKVVKAIRIARILRLLRIIKVFRQIKNADSVMAQRHVAMVSTISISVLVFSILGFTIAGSFFRIQGLESSFTAYRSTVEESILEQNLAEPGKERQLAAFASSHPQLLIVKDGGATRYTRYENSVYRSRFGPRDYSHTERGEVEIFFSSIPINQQHSRDNLLFFVVVVLLVAVFLIKYSPHFALTVSDPIHVMRRGMAEKDYNLEVRIPDEYQDDDIFRLAAQYNDKYLPLKDRNREEHESTELDLKLDDMQDLFGSGGDKPDQNGT
ncbi:MAG: ion transporter [Spirochaetales bacterium]|nr:ion transporter [Spirochaetales bacterium]MCF7937916.1 ion transporter [Spirochaetales bacterium]